MMSPKQRYQALTKSGEFEKNSQQEAVIDMLDAIYQQLLPRLKAKNFITKIFHHKKEPLKGLYLWGGVGIGKTWLMDIFYGCLPEQGKMRSHFHQFMARIHRQLKQLHDKQDPLKIIAKQIAENYQVICFDEFFVSDIADAMLLAGLFTALFQEGLTLVTTSNIHPDGLYKGGISRDRFLPAIELLKKYTDVVHIESEKDYRLRQLQNAGVYLMPLGEATRLKMRAQFDSLTDANWTQDELIIIAGRGIQTIRRGKGIIWFRFKDLCNIPRSQLDYLEIAKSFHTVLLSGVPKLNESQTNEAIYLINLVDVFYDAKVKLIVSADCAINEIYVTGQMQFEFARTRSRLQEMQSIEYLQQPHIY